MSVENLPFQTKRPCFYKKLQNSAQVYWGFKIQWESVVSTIKNGCFFPFHIHLLHLLPSLYQYLPGQQLIHMSLESFIWCQVHTAKWNHLVHSNETYFLFSGLFSASQDIARKKETWPVPRWCLQHTSDIISLTTKYKSGPKLRGSYRFN